MRSMRLNEKGKCYICYLSFLFSSFFFLFFFSTFFFPFHFLLLSTFLLDVVKCVSVLTIAAFLFLV